MRVLINAASANMGGALTYLTNVLGELPDIADDSDRFIVIVPPRTLDTLSSFVDSRMIELIPFGGVSGQYAQRLSFDHLKIPALIKHHNCDVLFSSTGFGSLRCPRPQVLLIRNLVYFSDEFKNRRDESLKTYYIRRARRALSLMSVKSADVVMFPTETMKRMVEKSVPLDGKVAVPLHYGFSRDRFFNTGAEKPRLAGDIDRWKSEGYFILLNIASYAVQKNFETVIEALPQVVESGVRLKFITTLSRDILGVERVHYDRMLGRVEELGLGDVLVKGGQFEYRKLHYLYERADVFVFPSFTESFGHPLVEAICSGLPLVAADTEVSRELCGEAALYFTPLCVDKCAAVLKELFYSQELRREMMQKANARAGHFSWTGYTEKLLRIFKKAAGLK